MVAIPTLETSRTRLRGYRPEDFEPYAAMWIEPSVVRFIGGRPIPREASWDRFLRQIGMWQYFGFGFFAIEDRETGRFIGEAGFHDRHRDLSPSIEGTMEAGWALVPSHQGLGLAEEVVRAAIGWAGEHGTGARLTCLIDRDHGASLHVAKKLGFAEFARTHYHGNEVVLLERPRQGR